MAATQEAEPRYALRAISLFGVLVLAKAITLFFLDSGFRDLAITSPWSPVAYFWQDVLVALALLLFDITTRTPWLAWTIYGALVGYAAINVPITWALSSPLTVTLIRATGGALADSISHYLTVPNLAGIALPVAAAIALPRWLAARNITIGPWMAAALVLVAFGLVALGPTAVSRVETRGLHRSAVGALVSTSLPRLLSVEDLPEGPESRNGWRVSPFEQSTGADLSRLRGSAKGRNVLLIVLESTAARYLGLYGARPDPTPTLTALARNAIVFERAYAVYPESIKGLFATLCSRYPAFDTQPDLYASVPCSSLAALLRSSGYQTALFHSGRFDYLGMRSVIDNRGFGTLEDAGAIGGDVHSSFGVDDVSTVERMLAWIDARRTDAPFFVTYLPIAGHHPYAVSAPGPFDGATDFRRYLNALHEGDAALAALMQGLQSRQLDRETLFVIFGDHGEAFGQHPGNYAHTLFVYEENIRVPYLILAPGLFESDTRVERPASVIDTAPTILDLLGVPVPSAYQGVSLLDRNQRLALFYTDYSLGWLGLADGCWKYLFEIDQGRSTLFDVCIDPDETRDRAREFPDRVAAYRDRVQKWAAAQKKAVEQSGRDSQ